MQRDSREVDVRYIHRRTRIDPGLPRLFDRLPESFDLSDEVQQESLLSTADALLRRSGDLQRLAELEWLMATEHFPLAARIATKLARSKGILLARRRGIQFSVVIPVYGEHERMCSPSEHDFGEDFLAQKLRQLGWLCGDQTRHRFELLIVDDGCPYGSGRLIERRLRMNHADAPARVHFLAEAIEAELPVVADMAGTDESRKGGAIHYGLFEATRKPKRGQVIVYTDADLSTHLGQAGLLVEGLDRPGRLIAAGSRRDARSVVVKSEERSARGRLFMYLWKQLLPELAYIDDSQCGFKALSAPVARHLIGSGRPPSERGLAFDLELLLAAERVSPRATAAVPIAWIDSEAASTTAELAPYLSMLASVARMSRTQAGSGTRDDGFADAILALDEATWERATIELGPRLEAVDPALDRMVAHLPAEALLRVAA